LTCRVFIGAEIQLDVGLDAAQARLANLARGGLLRRTSDDAFHDLETGLARVGPLGAAPGLSRLVAVRCTDMAVHRDFASMAIRWEATGPSGALFPALDADLKLTAAGEQATMLAVQGGLPAAARRPGRRAGPGDLAPARPGHHPGLHASDRSCHRPPGPLARTRAHPGTARAIFLAGARRAVDHPASILGLFVPTDIVPARVGKTRGTSPIPGC
jgi:hypothetical protein